MADAGAKPKVSRPKPNHPTFFEMAKAAISSLADKKGSSVQSIQTYIAGNYNLDIDFVKIHLKPALAKGIDNKTFIRPKGSDAKGYTGRFKINKAKQTEEAKAKKEKAAAKKEKESSSKTTKTSVVKKKSASAAKAKKPKSSTKSPKKVVKKKTPTKTASKSPKPPKLKTTAGTPKAKVKKLKAALKTPKQTPAKSKATKK